MSQYKVSVVMGSDSDLPVIQKCLAMLDRFQVRYDVHVISAHRTPERAESLAKGAADDGVGVIVAAAGKAAHLGGVLAAYTTLPVIGLPVKSSMMDGLDSLLSIVQMPKGIPVPPWPSTAGKRRDSGGPDSGPGRSGARPAVEGIQGRDGGRGGKKGPGWSKSCLPAKADGAGIRRRGAKSLEGKI